MQKTIEKISKLHGFEFPHGSKLEANRLVYKDRWAIITDGDGKPSPFSIKRAIEIVTAEPVVESEPVVKPTLEEQVRLVADRHNLTVPNGTVIDDKFLWHDGSVNLRSVRRAL